MTVLKHYEELRRAWRRLHAASGDMLKAFDEGKTDAMQISARLATEALQDISEASKALQRAMRTAEGR